MKNKQIINNKMQENNSEIRISRLKKMAAIVGTVAITGAMVAATVFVHSILPELTIPVLLSGTIFPIATVGYAKTKDSQIKAATTKNMHLRDIYTKGIRSTEGINRKKAKRIAELEDKQANVHDRLSEDSIIMAAGIAGWLIGTLSSLISPAMTIVTAGGIGAFTASVAKIIKHENKYSELEANIDSLKNDLVLGPIYKKEDIGANKTIQEMIQRKKEQRKNTPTYDKAVDQYVEQMTSTSVIDNLPKQYAKNKRG